MVISSQYQNGVPKDRHVPSVIIPELDAPLSSWSVGVIFAYMKCIVGCSFYLTGSTLYLHCKDQLVHLV
jgi:hypothetical protein